MIKVGSKVLVHFDNFILMVMEQQSNAPKIGKAGVKYLGCNKKNK